MLYQVYGVSNIKEKIMKKFKLVSVSLVVLLMFAMLTACKGDDEIEDISIAEDISEEHTLSPIATKYREVCEDMENYVAAIPELDEEYITYDYMYHDYDQDGEENVILYLEYSEDDTWMRDVVYLYYNEETDSIDVFAVVQNEAEDIHFYCDYNGKLARYSWSTTPYESYLYVVVVEDEKLTYVLEGAYDEIFTDYEERGMKPLPLYLHAGDYTDLSPFLK